MAFRKNEGTKSMFGSGQRKELHEESTTKTFMSDGAGNMARGKSASVDSDFEFSAEFLESATLYNVYDADGDGVYEGLISMEFLDGVLTKTDAEETEVLAYSVDENGTIALSDGTYISALVNVSDKNKIASAWDVDIEVVEESTAKSSQADGTVEYMFSALESATNFIA